MSVHADTCFCIEGANVNVDAAVAVGAATCCSGKSDLAVVGSDVDHPVKEDAVVVGTCRGASYRTGNADVTVGIECGPVEQVDAVVRGYATAGGTSDRDGSA